MKKDDSPAGIAHAAEAGIGAIQQHGGAQPGDRTMLDALAPALVAYKAALSTGAAIRNGACHVIAVQC